LVNWYLDRRVVSALTEQVSIPIKIDLPSQNIITGRILVSGYNIMQSRRHLNTLHMHTIVHIVQKHAIGARCGPSHGLASGIRPGSTAALPDPPAVARRRHGRSRRWHLPLCPPPP
jgi:hypothetical protein